MIAADSKRGPVRVVVIEDDADLGGLIVGELGNRGYDAAGVRSAAEALRAQTGNNATRAAQILGIDRRTLYRKLAGPT